MDKYVVARALDEISKYLEIGGENRFKFQAFRNAARRVESIEQDIQQFVATGQVDRTPGIGKAIGPMIRELVNTGSLLYLAELRQQFPAGIFQLVRVPGLGMKKIGLLYEKLGISDVAQLEEACRANRLAALPGFGAKTQENILAGIDFVKSHSGRFLLPQALEAAGNMVERIGALEGVLSIEVAGSLRRRLEIVQNIDLVVTSAEPGALIRRLIEESLLEGAEQLDEGRVRGMGRAEMLVDVRVCRPEALPVVLLRTTGNRDFVEAMEAAAEKRRLKVTDSSLLRAGRKVRLASEQQLFEAIGIPYIEPELREGAQVVGRAVPVRLVATADLRGTFHVHTTFSDGKGTVHEMLDAAHELGFEYVGISDHSKTASYAGGLTEERIVEQQKEIDDRRKAFLPMRVFKGTEADILQDGSIDYDEATLAKFDFVIASVHSRFKMDEEQMTARMLRALENPYVTFLGHLTGRRLLSREGYTLDFDRVFEAAARHGVMIEINGNPNRLDIDWRLLQRAASRGVGFSIHPDAHSTENLAHVISGTWVARKGGLAPEQIFNTRPLDEVEEYLKMRKQRAAGG